MTGLPTGSPTRYASVPNHAAAATATRVVVLRFPWTATVYSATIVGRLSNSPRWSNTNQVVRAAAHTSATPRGQRRRTSRAAIDSPARAKVIQSACLVPGWFHHESMKVGKATTAATKRSIVVARDHLAGDSARLIGSAYRRMPDRLHARHTHLAEPGIARQTSRRSKILPAAASATAV
jgi:hypothetical protein